ncbi:aspartyl-phosphate phosphatase Spo0E family protein [Cohnella sp. GCM10012308]|uniref:aspartyl-phosphate phosphatase Spo0E family protein n=1 Tax=Cohnella sp. GCM10012308 TaxID=3317329 RepID=UPI0036181FC8
MNKLERELEDELESQRKRLNELGRQLALQSIPLAEHREMQALSQKVDELVVRCQRMKQRRNRLER